jgi:hypothetical protein
MSTFFEETADKIVLRLANTTPDQHRDIILDEPEITPVKNVELVEWAID